MKINLPEFIKPGQVAFTLLLCLPFLFIFVFNLATSHNAMAFLYSWPYKQIWTAICFLVMGITIWIVKGRKNPWLWFPLGASIFYCFLFSPIITRLSEPSFGILDKITDYNSFLNRFTHILPGCDWGSCAYFPMPLPIAILFLIIFSSGILLLMQLGIRAKIVLTIACGWLCAYWIALDWLFPNAYLFVMEVAEMKLYQPYSLLIPFLLTMLILIVRARFLKRLDLSSRLAWFILCLFLAANANFLLAIRLHLFDFSPSIYEGSHHFANNLMSLFFTQFDLHWVRPLCLLGILAWLVAVPLLVIRSIRARSLFKALNVRCFREIFSAWRSGWRQSLRHLFLYFFLPVILLGVLFRGSVKVREIDWQLKDAVEQGDLKKAQNLIARGANIHVHEYLSEDGLLRSAALNLDREMVLLLINNEISCSVYSQNLVPIFHLLIRNMYSKEKEAATMAIFRILLDHGADIDCRERGKYGGYTPLHVAIVERRINIVKLLLQYHPNIHIKADWAGEGEWAVADSELPIHDPEISRIIREYKENEQAKYLFFCDAINYSSSAPFYIVVTVKNLKTGIKKEICTEAPFINGAMSMETGDFQSQLDCRKYKDRYFEFSKNRALKNINFDLYSKTDLENFAKTIDIENIVNQVKNLELTSKTFKNDKEQIMFAHLMFNNGVAMTRGCVSGNVCSLGYYKSK